jgi:hypothetical protein
LPLLDHFRPPISTTRHWESFHAAWATEIMRTLNRHVLPAGCFAEAQVHVGSRVEVDVATYQHNGTAGTSGPTAPRGVAVATWAPPAAALVMSNVFPDEIEIQVFSADTGATLVAAIELVSPGNKDRAETRRAFAAKCASYLHAGVGLVAIDIVTTRTGNLHDELVRALGHPDAYLFPAAAPLYAVAYRPTRDPAADRTEVWPFPLAVGQPLPTVPLALRGVATLPLALEPTYQTTCEDSRLV